MLQLIHENYSIAATIYSHVLLQMSEMEQSRVSELALVSTRGKIGFQTGISRLGV